MLREGEYAASAATRAELGVDHWSAVERDGGDTIVGYDRSQQAVLEFQVASTSLEPSKTAFRFVLRANGETLEKTATKETNADDGSYVVTVRGSSFDAKARALELLASDLRAHGRAAQSRVTRLDTRALSPLDTPELTSGSPESLVCPCVGTWVELTDIRAAFTTKCDRVSGGGGFPKDEDACSFWESTFGSSNAPCRAECNDLWTSQERAHDAHQKCRTFTNAPSCPAFPGSGR